MLSFATHQSHATLFPEYEIRLDLCINDIDYGKFGIYSNSVDIQILFRMGCI